MGVLIDGVWEPNEDYRSDAEGRFRRPRLARSATGSRRAARPARPARAASGPSRGATTSMSRSPARGRAARLIYRKLKGLETLVTLSVTHWLMLERGWTFDPGPGVDPRPDPRRARPARDLHRRGARLLRPRHRAGAVRPQDENDRQQRVGRHHPDVQFLLRRPRRHAGRLLPGGAARGDRRAQRADLRRLSTTASIAAASPRRSGPMRRRSTTCSRRSTISKPGSPTSHSSCGERVTEADWRLFTTLVRFDAVYVGHFKCNLQADRRLSRPHPLSRGALPLAGSRRDGRHFPHQASLLREPSDD